jgi:hypothetical protein
VPLHENDVLVLDEATQASTADLAMLQEAAKQAGARLNPVGDTEQLGSPEAGGMFQLLAHEVRRQRQDGTWTAPFKVPRSYLESSAELAYAGNVHVAQGCTVDTAHLLVTSTLTRRSLYVGMTRARQSNTAHVVTGSTAPEGKQPYEQAKPESVIKSIMQREPDDLSAIEQIRQSQERVGGTGHLLNLWAAAVRSRLIPEMDERIKARLSESEASRYQREPSRSVLQHKLRQYQLAGHDQPAHRPDHRRPSDRRPVDFQRAPRPPGGHQAGRARP